jgi:filamentous hemagglutinin
MNSSKGAKMPEDWIYYKGEPLDPLYIQAQAPRGEALRKWIDLQIETFKAQNRMTAPPP